MAKMKTPLSKAPLPTPTRESSVSVRKISNGFIVSQTKFTKTGCSTTEKFCATNPLTKK